MTTMKVERASVHKDDGITMNLQEDQTTLVLAGSWNPAILTPSWIGRNILGLDQDHIFQVAMLLPTQGQALAPRYTFEDISITPAQNQLIFHLIPDKLELVKKSFDVARKILETLPHTPVAAMGINISYNTDPLVGDSAKTMGWIDDISDLLLDDPDARVRNRLWQAGISTTDHMMNVTYRVDAQGAVVTVNHHYEVEGSAKTAANYLANVALFEQLFDVTNKFVQGLVTEDRA